MVRNLLGLDNVLSDLFPYQDAWLVVDMLTWVKSNCAFMGMEVSVTTCRRVCHISGLLELHHVIASVSKTIRSFSNAFVLSYVSGCPQRHAWKTSYFFYLDITKRNTGCIRCINLYQFLANSPSTARQKDESRSCAAMLAVQWSMGNGGGQVQNLLGLTKLH